MYSFLQEQGDVHMTGTRDTQRTDKVSEQTEVKTDETDGAASSEEKSPVLPEVERIVNTIMRPYLIGTSKGKCGVLRLLLR